MSKGLVKIEDEHLGDALGFLGECEVYLLCPDL